MKTYKVIKRYLPKSLTKSDKIKQMNELIKSRSMYKKNKYYTRKKINSFKSKPSSHVLKAKKMYNITSLIPSTELSNKTKCSIESLKKIVKKGEGAYFSSGSRPNQTAQSWGLARLASAITGGKSASVDFKILESGCSPNSKVIKLAKLAVKGTRKAPKTKITLK